MRRFLPVLPMLLCASAALAHDLPDPRVVVVVVDPGRLEIRVNERGHPGRESVETRRRFDANRDGLLGTDERSELEGFLATRATLNLEVRQIFEGKTGPPLDLATVSRTARGADGEIDRTHAISMDVVLRGTPMPDPDGRVLLQISDWRGDGHPVKVAVLGERVRLSRVEARSIGPAAGSGAGPMRSRETSIAPDGRSATGIELRKGTTAILDYRSTESAPSK